MSVGTWEEDYKKYQRELHLPPLDAATEKLFDRLCAYQLSNHHILTIAQALVNSRTKVEMV